MSFLYAISILCAMLPTILFLSYAGIANPANAFFAFGLCCCAGFLLKGRRFFIPSYSIPLLALAVYIVKTWDVSTLLGASLVCGLTYSAMLYMFSRMQIRTLLGFGSSAIVSSYYFALSGISMIVAVFMIVNHTLFAEVFNISLHTVILGAMFMCFCMVLLFVILPFSLKAITFVLGLLFGTWLFWRLGFAGMLLGDFLNAVSPWLPSTVLLEGIILPVQASSAELIPFEEKLDWLMSQPFLAYPTLALPSFALVPCIAMAIAGICLALEYVIHAHAAAALRGLPLQHYFQKDNLFANMAMALVGIVFVGLPLIQGAEGNALYRLTRLREQKAIRILAILTMLLAFCAWPLLLISSIALPVYGVMLLILAMYVLFVGVTFFTHKFNIREMAFLILLILTTCFAASGFLLPNIPFPAIWIVLVAGILLNIMTYQKSEVTNLL